MISRKYELGILPARSLHATFISLGTWHLWVRQKHTLDFMGLVAVYTFMTMCETEEVNMWLLPHMIHAHCFRQFQYYKHWQSWPLVMCWFPWLILGTPTHCTWYFIILQDPGDWELQILCIRDQSYTCVLLFFFQQRRQLVKLKIEKGACPVGVSQEKTVRNIELQNSKFIEEISQGWILFNHKEEEILIKESYSGTYHQKRGKKEDTD